MVQDPARVYLVDSNVFFLAAGKASPFKAPCQDFVRRIARGEVQAVVSAEILQEILHRYRNLALAAQGRKEDARPIWETGLKAYDYVVALFLGNLPITHAVMAEARAILTPLTGISSRDAVHAATVKAYKLAAIVSYDGDFDGIIPRLAPDQIP